LRKFEDNDSLTRFLRLHTFMLSRRPKVVPRDGELPEPEKPAWGAKPRVSVQESPQSELADLENEIEQLRASNGFLVRQGNFSVFVAGAPEIPNLLREIGRLREIAFREVGEGTGEHVDIDKFDDYYLHLFLWDEQTRQVAGAYRIGRADMILRQFGPKGLYTSSLFKFQTPFLSHLDDALELGRSFIVPQYQRNLSTLPILWKGISVWITRHPRYKKLFGPVSISRDYHGLSRKLIVEFLNDNRLHPDLATLVKPRKPFRYLRNRKILREFISAELKNVDDFSALISSIEEDGKGIPMLLKHYLRLKGTLLSFNVDKSFSSCLDGLIMVDLTETDPKLLAKYMGEEASGVYLAHHGLEPPVQE
jgi:putative hemolysin